MSGYRMSINNKISDIREMFLILENPMDKYTQIIEFGKKNEGLSDDEKNDDTSSLVKNLGTEKDIKAIWVDSSLAEFSMVLRDEIARYGLSIEFGPAVSFFGQLLAGVDPTDLNPVKKLNKNQFYFFTHGDKDERMLPRHYEYFKKYASENNIKADFWLAKNSYHVDGMFKYPEEYSKKMYKFFEDNLK